MLYFDHCSSTPPHPEVVRTLSEVMLKNYANPSSIHLMGLEADKLIQRARQLAADLYGTKADEWVFTSGGTESNNLAVKGAAKAYSHRGKHLITTAIEHPSVYEAFKALEEEGFSVTYLPVEADGRISVDKLAEVLTEQTILVSVMQVNNETGAIQPIAEIGRLLSAFPKTLFHVDGVQAAGKLATDLKGWEVDMYSISAHKLQGPKGSGWLYVREGVSLVPVLSGGGQERGLRSGTPNVAGIVASAKALRMAVQTRDERYNRLMRLRSRLASGLADMPRLVIHGADAASGTIAPHILSCSLPGLKPEVIVHALELEGIVISTKSACSSRKDQPSRVLLAMGCEHEAAVSSLRISLGDEHTEQDIDRLIDRLRVVVEKLEPLAARRHK
ncbi:cysteine desulfurase family protein [Paenibacillus sp. GCM10012307]|uniref:Cysteine desulfurase n=2 Tax=Paenibacillus roseus TaxID=2798579 RepID=A0A934MMB7_9BACL|nr:cysteine desulfurase family protein [Paenibacillus roseus]MBJ6363130.1 cysteine desulfurase [Paenibacillus roseus]